VDRQGLPDHPFAGPDATTPPSGGTRRIRSEELLRGGSEVVIEHRGREYRLRVTQNGKLILTA
jgi:hemin uptake protein HemP